MTQKTQIPSDLTKVLEWARDPKQRRGITITINVNGIEDCWLYDYHREEGVFIETDKDIPSNETLEKLRKERLQEEMDRL